MFVRMVHSQQQYEHADSSSIVSLNLLHIPMRRNREVCFGDIVPMTLPSFSKSRLGCGCSTNVSRASSIARLVMHGVLLVSFACPQLTMSLSFIIAPLHWRYWQLCHVRIIPVGSECKRWRQSVELGRAQNGVVDGSPIASEGRRTGEVDNDLRPEGSSVVWLSCRD